MKMIGHKYVTETVVPMAMHMNFSFQLFLPFPLETQPACVNCIWNRLVHVLLEETSDVHLQEELLNYSEVYTKINLILYSEVLKYKKLTIIMNVKDENIIPTESSQTKTRRKLFF